MTDFEFESVMALLILGAVLTSGWIGLVVIPWVACKTSRYCSECGSIKSDYAHSYSTKTGKPNHRKFCSNEECINYPVKLAKLKE